MKKQMIIILDPNEFKSKKGDFFEDIVSRIFETQRYHLKKRVNFTGMEIDLIASHKDKTELAYIECKAKDRLDSSEIKVFAFNVKHHEANCGYFLSTSDYEHQVAGLIDEMKNSGKYPNLYFWGPSKLFELLESSSEIKPINYSHGFYIVTKHTLAWTYFGIFHILILMENTFPVYFCVIDARNGSYINNTEIVNQLKENIPEINDLEVISFSEETCHKDQSTKEKPVDDIENIIEVQESENWYDYLPASSKHFIGRKSITDELLDFIQKVGSKKTSRRIFYIDGKSGWGKSSLINYLRGWNNIKRDVNPFYVFAVDVRSASSSNFVGLSFKKLAHNAIRDNFLRNTLFYLKLDLISGFDVLGSESAHSLLDELERQNKILVLIFDQFEDVFRKPSLYKAFHKFLHDVDGAKSNLILGFSWKSEINVPIEHEAYYLWQQDKDFAVRFSVKEFDQLEIKEVIKQLESSIGHSIDSTLKSRLIESSQGYPWLIKKLCIHVYQQIKSGKTIESLIEQDLNCKALFDDDLEGLSPKETSSLKYIAVRSFEGNLFETTEVDDIIEEKTLTELVNKRLVIKLGTKYNVYWDIFRDYLVTDKVPPIGESYILRQYVNVCVEVYKLFSCKDRFTLDELVELSPSNLGLRTMDNILRELRMIGLVRKIDDSFEKSKSDIPPTDEGFKVFMHDKFSRYTPYQKLKQINSEFITFSDIILVLKDTFKATSFEEKTWEVYAKNLVNWFYFADLDIMERFIDYNKIRTSRNSPNKDFMPNKRPKNDMKVFSELNVETQIDDFKKLQNPLYDLKCLGLIKYRNGTVNLTETGKIIKSKYGTPEFEKLIAIEAMKTTKICQAANYLFHHSECTRYEFEDGISDILNNIKSDEYKIRSRDILYSWAKFINANLEKVS
ncbi:MAG: restriction endonuclease [Methanomethylovorans sp.]|uniref:nSTAND1 domain-containing NTPase n=1 Tax=Methanomethylovorans sp. TaxID=2758717 RepID=UPI0035314656